MDKKEEE